MPQKKQGTLQAAAPAPINVITGTANQDFLIGTPGADLMLGMGGWGDTLYGRGGNDILRGSDEVDFLSGEDGDDRLHGGGDIDFLHGGIGQDLLFGEDGADILGGGPGDDKLWGGAGQDFANGQDGNDRIHGDADADFLAGGAGRDTIYGDAGDDVLWGGLDDDRLEGGADQDDLHGGSGRDVLLGGHGADALRGGLGDDALLGGGGHDRLFGERGNDRLVGGGGADHLFGDSGSDYAMQAVIKLPVGETVARVATDGDTLVATASSGQIFFYDVHTQKLTGSVDTATQFSITADAAVSDGRILVGTAPFMSKPVTGIGLYDIHGTLLHTVANPVQGGTPGFGSVIALDGDRAAVATNTNLYLYDADTGALRSTFTLPPPDFGEGWYVSEVELSGDTVALHAFQSAGGSPAVTFVLDADTGALRHKIYPAGIDLDEAGTRDIALDGDTLIITEPRDRVSLSVFDKVHQYQSDSGVLVRTLDLGKPPESLTPVDSHLVDGVDVGVGGGEILVRETIRPVQSGELGLSVSPDFLLFDADDGSLIQRIVNADADPEDRGTFALSNGVLAMTTASQGGAGAIALYWRDQPGDGGLDYLDGGAGDDVLTGGPKADIFVMGQGGGHDRIEDFDAAEGDRILVRGLGTQGIGDLAITDSQAGSLIFRQGVSIELVGVDPADLSAQDFLFA
jgi:Ca2+-binding RTX toxin-like protein